MDIVSFDGWALEAVVDIDIVCPGFAGVFLRASDERRQVITAFLATTEVADHQRADIGATLARSDHRTILGKAFGKSIPGLRGALSRSGPKPHNINYYKVLHNSLSDGPSHVISVIKQLDRLGPAELATIDILPPDLCDHRIITRLHGVDHAADFVRAVALMERHGVDRSSLVAALKKSSASIETVMQRWLLRLPLAVGPISETPGYRPIRDGRALRAAALRYRNCSRRYLLDSIAGESAFAEYCHPDGRQVLIHYQRMDGLWCLDGAYAARNRTVSDDLKKAVQGLAAKHGVVEYRASKQRDEDMAALRRFGRSAFAW